jgi:hypothetical protein
MLLTILPKNVLVADYQTAAPDQDLTAMELETRLVTGETDEAALRIRQQLCFEYRRVPQPSGALLPKRTLLPRPWG